MGESADQIEQQINETCGQLSENLNELEERVKSAFDWRTQFEERPVTLLAVAFAGGVLASALLPSKRSLQKNEKRGEGRRNYEDYMESANGRSSGVLYSALKNAIVAVAAKQVGGALSNLVSGYKEGTYRGEWSDRYPERKHEAYGGR